MNKDVYIHYGHNEYNDKLFKEIKNKGFVKPTGGLWASSITACYAWKDWCRENNFRECIEDNSFKFKLKPGTRKLTIDNHKQLLDLPNLDVPYRFTWVTLDFEKIKEEYDAIEVLISNDPRLYWDLYGWDCDSLLVLNKDCIDIIKMN